MIKFNRIPTQHVEVWNKDGYFATVNQHELDDLRIQICKYYADDYYVIFEGKNIKINPSGTLEDWPRGFFDKIETYLGRLSEVQREYYSRKNNKQ